MLKKTLFARASVCLGVFAAVAPSLRAATDFQKASLLVEQEKWSEALPLLEKEVDVNPGHEAAYVLLIQAYEKSHREKDAIAACGRLLQISRYEDHRNFARREKIRLVRETTLKEEHAKLRDTDLEDPFHIDMPVIDDAQWARLKVVEDTNYIRSDGGQGIPPFRWRTQHFDVYACNEELAQVCAERAELYLDFMSKRLFGGREWAFRVPISIYKDENDYISVGGAPQGSHGVTSADFFSRSSAVLIFQLIDIEEADGNKHTEVYKYAVESILPHELTHVMLNEFFGLETPQWLHEAVAGRMEQTRDQYLEAARLSRAVVAGEYFRLRDLFEQEGYPARVSQFYEQAAIVVLFIFEAGPDAMYTFFTELANHPIEERHDAACAALLGIPQKAAVDEFERQWVEWMTRRYAKDLEPDIGEAPTGSIAAIENSVFLPRISETDTVGMVQDWRSLDLADSSLFKGIGASGEDWSFAKGSITCKFDEPEGRSFLAIQVRDLLPPLIVECEVKWKGDPAAQQGWVGFNQVTADVLDTSAQVMGRLTDNGTHKLTCLLHDDLVLYLDGQCVGRDRARVLRKNERDIDYPLALVTNGPIEVVSMKVARVEKWSTQTVQLPPSNNPGDPNNPAPPPGHGP